jgi:hypothetical protein
VAAGCDESVPTAHGRGDVTRYQYGRHTSQFAEISLPAGSARRAGDKSELQTFDGDHFEPITVGSPAWDLCVAGVSGLIG